jgi:hypothetical protein
MIRSFIKIAFLLLLVAASTHVASVATLSTATAQDTYKVGDQFNADIKINSDDVGINASQAVITFSPAILEVVSIDKTNSVFNFWIEEPTFDNTKGTISFVGGASSGLVGKSLQVLRVVFKAKGLGDAPLIFTDGAITASDGSGTNVLTQMVKQPLTIGSTSKSQIQTIERTAVPADTVPAKPVITVPLYPNQNAWYASTTKFTASWQLPNDVSAVASELNKSPTYVPTKSKGVYANETFSALGDGVSYVHVRFYNNKGWSTTAHYRIGIDTVPPVPFKIAFSGGLTSDNPSPTISYETKDPVSVVDTYQIQIDQQDPVSVTSNTYTLPPQKPGTHTVIVRAIDSAGNMTESSESFEVLPITSPKIFSVSTPVYAGEGNLFVTGESEPEHQIELMVLDLSGVPVYTFTTRADEKGMWSTKIDAPLKKGQYRISALSRDKRQAQSLPILSQEITVNTRPIAVIFGFNLQAIHVIIGLLIVMFLGAVIGWYMNRMMKLQEERKITVSARDVSASFNVIRSDVKKALASLKRSDFKPDELNTLLTQVNATADKMEKYIISGIKEINKN